MQMALKVVVWLFSKLLSPGHSQTQKQMLVISINMLRFSKDFSKILFKIYPIANENVDKIFSVSISNKIQIELIRMNVNSILDTSYKLI